MQRKAEQWIEGNAFLVKYSYEKDGEILFDEITVFGEFGLNINQLQLISEAALDYAINGIGVDASDIEEIKALPRPIVMRTVT